MAVNQVPQQPSHNPLSGPSATNPKPAPPNYKMPRQRIPVFSPMSAEPTGCNWWSLPAVFPAHGELPLLKSAMPPLMASVLPAFVITPTKRIPAFHIPRNARIVTMAGIYRLSLNHRITSQPPMCVKPVIPLSDMKLSAMWTIWK